MYLLALEILLKEIVLVTAKGTVQIILLPLWWTIVLSLVLHEMMVQKSGRLLSTVIT